ncbi:GHKL domain-containing protein [Fontibacillus phaseoli]|uniref:GHKL domain-containing protein n=1 Tax=Fontibacillus phaseoli TaxID=1416533 RepID=A0A369B4K7_9BACL|nr:sensor histidine kinase [Fontibacillus phaseoli]RCX16413.1 GHKL domain-containing protein [Fontibacillus phaseoli]
MTLEEINQYYAIATKVYEAVLQGMLAFFFYRFCRIYTDEKRLIGFIAILYFLIILSLNTFQPGLENFWVCMIASTVAFLLMWPLLRLSVQIETFISVTYFAIRWLGPSIVSMLFLPINRSLLRLYDQVIDSSSEYIGLYYFYYNLGMIVVMMSLYWLVMWLFVLAYKKINSWYRADLSTKEIIILLIPAFSGISSYALLNQFNKLTEANSNPLFMNRQILSYWAIHNLIILAAMLIVLVLFQRLEIQREDKRKQFILENQIKNIEQHISGVEGTYRELRSLRHDLRNHITVIERLLEQQQYTETERYLTSIQKVLAHKELSFQTGNPITDILLHEKSEQAKQFNITFSSTFYYPAGDQINAFDMSVILHNALENALEATKTLENGWIEVSSKQFKNSYLLTIRNPFASTLEWEEHKWPLTTKKDRVNHGIGLNNIQEIARKYYGDLEFEVDSSIFQINILLISPESANVE